MKYFSFIVAAAILLFHNLAFSAETTLRAITSTVDGTTSIVRFEFSKPVSLPSAFFSGPTSVILDLGNVKNLGPKKILVNSGNLVEINVRTSTEKTRVVILLLARSNFELTIAESSAIIIFKPPADRARTTIAQEQIVQPTIEFPSSSTTSENPTNLLANAKIAFDAGNYQTSIEKLNALLLLPPMSLTQEAQELIGQAYERLKQPEKAMAEYKAFIAMYPTEQAVGRIKQRLLALELTTPEKVQRERPKHSKNAKGSDVAGSVSAYFYAGAKPTTSMSWASDQTVAIVNTTATGTFRDDQYTFKISGRGTFLSDLNGVKPNRRTLPLLYGSIDDSLIGYGVRVGRQNATAGILGRFDGVSGYYRVDDDDKIVFGYGIPYVGSPSSRRSMSIGIDSALTTSFGALIYLNRQKVDGVPEREAYGFEGRYFQRGLSIAGTLEYDAIYRKLNTSMIQSTLNFGDNTVYLLADRRLSPALFAERLLQLDEAGAPRFTTVGEVFEKSGYSREELYQHLATTSPVSKAVVISWSNQLTPDWLGSISGQTTNYYTPSSTAIIPTLDATESTQITSSTRSIGAQLLGTNTPIVGSQLHLLGNYSKSRDAALWYIAVLGSVGASKTKADLMFRVDKTQRQLTTVKTFGATIRLNHKFDSGISIESQYSLVRTITLDELLSLTSALNAQTIFIGFRYEI